MLASISPVGEAGRRQRWATTASAYLVGTAVGGLALGVVLGTLGELLRTASWGHWRWAVLAVIVASGAAVDAGWLPLRLAGWRRQVDERWLTTYRGWVYGLGYGTQLGVGVVTIVTSTVTYATVATMLLVGDVARAGTIGLVFGAVRALPVLATWPVRTPARLRALHRVLSRCEQPVARATIAAQLLVAATAGVLAVGGAP